MGGGEGRGGGATVDGADGAEGLGEAQGLARVGEVDSATAAVDQAQPHAPRLVAGPAAARSRGAAGREIY